MFNLHIESGKQPDKQLEEWIDRAVMEGQDVREVAAGIVAVTQPGGTSEYEVSPELVGNEGWYWPWNRAGLLCLERRRPTDAATLFRCAYLAALRFQHVGQYRLHKAMPLCNISYACLRAEQEDQAVLPALLAMVEDAATSGKPTETGSFQNLLAANYPAMPAQSLGGFFLLVTRQRGLAPLYPETVLECAGRANILFSPELVTSLTTVAEAFGPRTIGPSLERLALIWESLRPRIESLMDRRPLAHGQPTDTIPRIESYAPSGTGTLAPSS